jgi:hypothetical protein
MAEPVGGDGEFHRHVGVLVLAQRLETEMLAAMGEDPLHLVEVDKPVEEVVQHDPLVVPAHDPARLLECAAVA